MSNGNRQPGLDGRHRDADGRISEKHGNTRVDTLRDRYGDGFRSRRARRRALAHAAGSHRLAVAEPVPGRSAEIGGGIAVIRPSPAGEMPFPPRSIFIRQQEGGH